MPMETIKLTFCVLVFVKCVQIAVSEWTAEGRIGIRFYTEGPTIYVQEPLEEGVKILKNPHYIRSLPMLILIHGMDASVDCGFVEESVKAIYFKGFNKNFNIIALNLPELMAIQSIFDKSLYRTAMNSQIAGDAIGKFLVDMISQKLISAEQIYVVGYSMGAQVAGYLARQVKEAHGLIYYIMGLDPAGIGFTPDTLAAWYTNLVHVTAADARYVHFMHCNSIGWGTKYHNATANFVFNGGDLQPGCLTSTNLGCSHNMVPFFFIESILYSDKFLAKKCNSLVDFTNCHCSEETRLITFPPDLDANGSYYLRTNAKTPFGQGEEGIRCTDENEIAATKDSEENKDEHVDRKKVQEREKHEEKEHDQQQYIKPKRVSPGFQHRTMDEYEKMQQKTPLETDKTLHNIKPLATRKDKDESLDEMLEKLHHILINK